MREIWTVFRNYCGTGIYPFLFLAALIYLLLTEKDRKIRLVLAESSLVTAALFFLPLFKTVMNALGEGETYYRILWLLPMTAVIAYAGIRIIGRHSRVGLIGLAAVLILSGQYVYQNQFITKAQNRFHIPDAVVAICNEIMPAQDEERVWAVFPEELIYYVRQYTSEVQMPYGREMLEPSWEWNWDTHPIYEVMRENPIDLDALSPLLTEYHCQYLILNRGIPVEGDPEENGLALMAQIEAYDLYRNTAVELYKKTD